jgi:AcrR family transcriptional regulator
LTDSDHRLIKANELGDGMAARKGGSRDRLLDAAEYIFAEKGYDLATTREIVARAGDTLGTLSYHFKTKEALLVEVLARRFDEMHEQRRAVYNDFAAKRDGATPDLGEAITAIVAPVMRLALSRRSGWNDYIVILCRVIYAAGGDQERITASLLDPIATELLGWMKAATPASAHVNVAYAYQFIIACMLDSAIQAKNDRLTRITDGAASSADAIALNDRLVPFLVAGTKAILNV